MKRHILNGTLAAALLTTAHTGVAFAADTKTAKPGIISISATGRANAVPDMAVLNLSVRREAETAREALTANNNAMGGVLAAMKEAGVEDRDLQTSNFNIQPQYVYPKSSKNRQPEPPRIIGYIVANSLTVRVRDLEKLGSIMDQSVSLGVNGGGNITFRSSNPDPIIEQARKDAMARAIAKAKTLTTSAGVELGRIQSINESSRGIPRPRAMAKLSRSAAVPESVPVARGESSYSITVNVQWEIKQ